MMRDEDKGGPAGYCTVALLVYRTVLVQQSFEDYCLLRTDIGSRGVIDDAAAPREPMSVRNRQ